MFHKYWNALWYIKTHDFIYIKSQTWHDFLAEFKEEISTVPAGATSIHLDALLMGIQESVHTDQVIGTGTFYCTLSSVFTCANKGALSPTKTMVKKVVVPSSQKEQMIKYLFTDMIKKSKLQLFEKISYWQKCHATIKKAEHIGEVTE